MDSFWQLEKEAAEREAAKLQSSKLLTASEAKGLQSTFNEDIYREYILLINTKILEQAKRNVNFVVITESPMCYWMDNIEKGKFHLFSETEKRIFSELQKNGFAISNYFHEDGTGEPIIGLQLSW